MRCRIFVAVLISTDLQNKILKWRENWQPAGWQLPVRWLAEKNLHITLIPPWYEKNINKASKRLKTISMIQPFEIAFEKVCFGPDPRSPRLIWAEGKTPKELINLKSVLETALHHKSKTRPFVLHLTLARFQPQLFSSFSIKQLNEPVSWHDNIASFALMESRLLRKGAEYTTVQEFKLQTGT